LFRAPLEDLIKSLGSHGHDASATIARLRQQLDRLDRAMSVELLAIAFGTILSLPAAGLRRIRAGSQLLITEFLFVNNFELFSSSTLEQTLQTLSAPIMSPVSGSANTAFSPNQNRPGGANDSNRPSLLSAFQSLPSSARFGEPEIRSIYALYAMRWKDVFAKYRNIVSESRPLASASPSPMYFSFSQRVLSAADLQDPLGLQANVLIDVIRVWIFKSNPALRHRLKEANLFVNLPLFRFC
jgi:hypothetical protein